MTSCAYFRIRVAKFVLMATTSSSLFVSQTGVRRHVYLLAAASFALILIIYYRPVRSNGSSFLPSTPLHGGSDVASYNTWDADVDANNLTLDSRTCDVFFPFLFHEVERAVSDRKGRHITKDELDAITPRNGYVRAMIYDQQVRTEPDASVLRWQRDTD